MNENEKIQELLKPRYKTIADYPHNPFPVGQLLDGNGESFLVTRTQYQDFGELHFQNNYVPTDYLDKFPHLFEKLEWWEEREIPELPTLIKPNPERDFMKDDNWVYKANWRMHDNGPAHWVTDFHFIHANNVLPATEADYLSFISKTENQEK